MPKKWRSSCPKGTIMSMRQNRKCIPDTYNPIQSLTISPSGVTVIGNDGDLSEAHQDRIIDKVWSVVGEEGIKGLPFTSYPSRGKMKTRIKFEKGVYKQHKTQIKKILRAEI